MFICGEDNVVPTEKAIKEGGESVSTLTTQNSCPSLDPSWERLRKESQYVSRLFNTLLTIPEEYWGAVTRTLNRWVEEGAKPGTSKFLKP